jgi:hypothetical protein
MMRLALFLMALVGGGLLGGPAGAMSYHLVDVRGQPAIFAHGRIELDETERFLAFLQRMNGPVPGNLIVHSPGGNLRGAVSLGLTLRRVGATVVVASARALDREAYRIALRPGTCASACVYMLMGGRSRVVTSGSRLVVHQARRVGDTSDIRGGYDPRLAAVNDALARYAIDMGIDPRVIAIADSVPHESGRILTNAEIRRFRLVTRR